MKDQKHKSFSSQTRRIDRTTSPRSRSVFSDRWWSLNAMSRLMSPVDAIWQSGHGQIAPNFFAPQLKQSAQVIGRPLVTHPYAPGGWRNPTKAARTSYFDAPNSFGTRA